MALVVVLAGSQDEFEAYVAAEQPTDDKFMLARENLYMPYPPGATRNFTLATTGTWDQLAWTAAAKAELEAIQE